MDTLTTLHNILAILRAQQVSYHVSHWQASGPLAFADHMLFDRLYSSMAGEIDTIGEKIVGAFGSQGIKAAQLATDITGWVARWADVQDPVARGLASEAVLQTAIKVAVDNGAASGMSLGLDNALRAIADAHETNIMLLRQRAVAPVVGVA